MPSCRIILSIFLLVLYGKAPAQAHENIVFEGAGIRGLAYSGVIAELEAQGVLKNVKRVAGTSAGAITALMLCLNYNADEVAQVIQQTRFQKFNSGRYFFLGGMHRMNRYFGWYRGRRFEQWLDALIKAKTGNADITFAGLKERGYKDLFVTGTDLTLQKAVLFSYETFPQMRIRDAVRISMSIPLYFEAVFLKNDGTVVAHPKHKKDLHVLVDGGFVANFPIRVFDSTRYTDTASVNKFAINHRTIGIRIDSEAQRQADSTGAGLVPLPVTTLKQYVTAFYTMVLENLNRQPLTHDDWQRTVSVSDGGIGPRIKRLQKKEADLLIQNGRSATAIFLNSRPH
jgi:NTE family protein